MLLMINIWKTSQNLNICICCHIYRETNRTINCLIRKYIYNLKSFTYKSNFPKDVIKFDFEDYYVLFLIKCINFLLCNIYIHEKCWKRFLSS